MKRKSKRQVSSKRPVPKVGQRVYVGTSVFLEHGQDDFIGGLATIDVVKKSMSAGKMVDFVVLKERPSWKYNWEFLWSEQKELKKRFGKQEAHADPDMREQFNVA